MKPAILALLSTALFAQTEYRGTLEPELFVPGGLYERVEFKPADGAQRKPLGNLAGASDHVFVGKIREAVAFLVEPATLYVDVDGDGSIGENERFEFAAGIASVRFPLAKTLFKTYPVSVYFGAQKPGECVLGESPRAFVRGSATIGGRTVAAGFAFDWKKNVVSPNDGWQGFDGEYSFVKGEHRVYHLGDAYARVRSVDLERREFVLEARSAHEYDRIELKTGEIFPDFSFADLDGATHRLSEYAGPRTLLDFWATWCAPCLADIPRLREANARGIQIIGMNVDQDQSKVRDLHLPWTQTQFASIRELVERQAGIQEYPTYVLLDRGRRIVALGEDALGAELYCDRCDPSNWLRPEH